VIRGILTGSFRGAVEMIAANEIQLWCLTPDSVDEVHVPRWRGWLTDEERNAIDRFHFQNDRRDRLFARILTRSALSAFTGVPPDVWRFRRDSNGKPTVELPQQFEQLTFSLSHTRGLIACLVGSDRMLGIDVEYVDRIDDWTTVAKGVLSSSEITCLRGLPERDQRRRFFELWTLKESYAKAIGLGLGLPLDRVAFEISGSGGRHPRAFFEEPLVDDPQRWSFRVNSVHNSHVLSTSVVGADVNIVWNTTRTPEVCPSGTLTSVSRMRGLGIPEW
jgi:4'-phosphopantetheinyl transferase